MGLLSRLWQLLMDKPMYHEKAIVHGHSDAEMSAANNRPLSSAELTNWFLLLQLQASCFFTANALDKNTRHHVSYLGTISLDITGTF